MRDEGGKRYAGEGAGDAAGDGGHPPTPLREAELPLRGWTVAARPGGPQLFPGEPDRVLDASRGGSGTSSSGDAALSRGACPPRETGGDRPQRAGEQPGTAPDNNEANPFSASDELYQGVVGFFTGEEAAGLTHCELEARLHVDGRALFES